jgi:alpha-galactosidase
LEWTHALINNRAASYAGDGYWNFPDMLVVGNQGLTLAEQKVHFALWCIMTSPLILGNDPRHMSPQVLAIITNKDAIAIDQDPTEQGTLIKRRGDKQIWAKQLRDGSHAVLMINLNKRKAQDITLKFIRLGFTGKVQLKNIYKKKDIGTFKGSFIKKIAPQSGLFLLVSRANQ